MPVQPNVMIPNLQPPFDWRMVFTTAITVGYILLQGELLQGYTMLAVRVVVVCVTAAIFMRAYMALVNKTYQLQNKTNDLVKQINDIEAGMGELLDNPRVKIRNKVRTTLTELSNQWTMEFAKKQRRILDNANAFLQGRLQTRADRYIDAHFNRIVSPQIRQLNKLRKEVKTQVFNNKHATRQVRTEMLRHVNAIETSNEQMQKRVTHLQRRLNLSPRSRQH